VKIGCSDPHVAIRATILLMTALAMGGCGDPVQQALTPVIKKKAEREAAVETAVLVALANSTAPEVRSWAEFKDHWPVDWQSLGFAFYGDEARFKGAVDATTLIDSRYVLKIIVDFELSADYREAVFPRTRFHVFEVREVRPGGGGQGGYSVSFGPVDRWFGPDEWERLRRSNWDFSALGIGIVSNAPVPSIRKVLPVL
jgi:hypothetical protein